MLAIIRSNVLDLPANVSLGYLWCSGFMISGFMFFQVLTGVVLSFLYVSGCEVSFSCVTGFTNESLFVWLVRYAHIWGVTFIFFYIFLHMGRALYYSSYSKFGVWNVGFFLYLFMMVEAFLSYILPWHQMSYWAATVLTSVVDSIPFVGNRIYSFVVGGFSVSEATLVRVFSAHVCLAFVIVGLSVVHLFYLHKGGSNNPLFVGSGYSDVVLFHSFFTLKDGFVLLFSLCLCVGFTWLCPDLVVDTEAYIEANPLVTPVTIKPEWYFLPFYAMLRSVESKIGGLFLVILFLFLLWLPTFNEACCYYDVRQVVFWFLVSLFFLLGYLGSCHPEYPYIGVGKVSSILMLVLLLMFKGMWIVPHSGGFCNLFSFL
uniref:Cytochrome b n=1 Tax=Dicrocoelium chinensis TaxID=483157 RepID=A0A096XCB6_DICCN|nr:cytochrome b [Dicrocoelium chinensis]AHG06497.1 cytochrome b [Dicrocoelium chinensis]